MKKILFLLIYINTILGMEQPEALHEPIIVNYNDGEQLPKEITSGVIFGATPRMSRFHEFSSLVAHDIHEILESKPKGMRKDLRKLKNEKQDTLLKMEQHFRKNHHSDTALHCFFAHGFNRKLLGDNMSTLVKSAQKCRDGKNLIHVFLPSYFEENDFKDMSREEQHELLKRFLLSSALFYKRLYAEQKLKQAVHIVIPPAEDFEEKASASEIGKISEIITNVLKKRFFDRGIKKTTLLNQFELELKELGNKLGKMGYSQEDIVLQSFKIYAGGKETAIFTPYTIPTDKIPSPLLSCVVSKDLVETFEQLEKKK